MGLRQLEDGGTSGLSCIFMCFHVFSCVFTALPWLISANGNWYWMVDDLGLGTLSLLD